MYDIAVGGQSRSRLSEALQRVRVKQGPGPSRMPVQNSQIRILSLRISYIAYTNERISSWHRAS